MQRTLVLVVAGASLLACEVGTPVRACPSLVVGEWTWFGVIGPPGSAQPGEWVRLYHPGDEEYGDTWFATPTGSFALRAAGRTRRGEQPEAVLELVRSGVRYRVRPGPSEALIEYAAGSRPVMQTGPAEMTFTGWLSSERASTPIAGAWVVDWTTGEVDWIDPPPSFGTPFSVTMPGGLHHCLTIYTEHRDDGTGGCWWPRGGGCLCHRCTVAEERAGTCHEEPPQSSVGPHFPCGCNSMPPADPSHPPREPLPVDERHDPPPPPHSSPPRGPPDPDRGDDIPVGAPPPIPEDAWTPPMDAWHPRLDGGIPI